jgi:hypothetical protein
MESVRRGHEVDVISAAYSSDAGIGGADLWIYGHTHESRDFESRDVMSGTTRVVSNQKGYGPWRDGEPWENPGFNPNFVIEI